MRHYKEHLIVTGTSIRDALSILDKLAQDAICFVVNDELKLLGSLTDGDIRRGLIAGIELDDTVDSIIQKEPKFLRKGDYDLNKVIEYRDNNYKVIPIVTKKGKIINVINFRHLKSYLPIDVVIMAG
ncbi:MAG TPA: nucleotidyltransferase, partial [Balneola sp.]|nr:nucleotidyltransferase [Balneola sp.]